MSFPSSCSSGCSPLPSPILLRLFRCAGAGFTASTPWPASLTVSAGPSPAAASLPASSFSLPPPSSLSSSLAASFSSIVWSLQLPTESSSRPLNLSARILELDSPRSLRVLRGVCWTIALAAGFLQTWAARFSMTPDGTCYLDIASAYLRGDWHNAINSYWSPLFSWLLALAIWIFHPAPYWESTLLHLVNFAGI